MKLGMIGGEGKMGRLFAPIFEKYVDEVVTSSQPVDIAKHCDIIVFTVPIEATPEVIESLLPHIEKRHLLMDFTSLKEKPCAAMMHSQGSVIGLHPLFGPSVPSLEGQTVALCPLRPGKWLPWLTDLLDKEGAKRIEVTPQTHDEIMALVQSLVHFSSLLFAETLRQKGVDPQKLLEMATPVYKMQLHIAQRITNQSPELYRAIQFENPYFLSLLEIYEKSFATLRKIVASKDSKGFETFFNSCHTFFGKEALEEGQKMTDQFIEVLKRNAC
ncbi:MAG: prephenate dehydrogenase/arogenate dehydrogenase family protein [Chlamydiia bacterium]|nr:prephenate dehydrogenase/arogenate dehydrogenase family protein [Chlamydiia bacterium]